MKENRRKPRWKIDGARVTWQEELDPLRSRRLAPGEDRLEVINVSANGLAFHSAHPPRKGSEVLLRVFLPSDSQAYSTRGVVAWTKSFGETVSRDVSEIWSCTSAANLCRSKTFGVGVQFDRELELLSARTSEVGVLV